MAADSAIEWTHHTFNPWRGCTKVSAGCANCYADTLSKRNPRSLGVWGPRGTRVVAAEAYWREPLKWDRAAKAAGERHRVFCASMADVFEGPDTMPAECVAPVDSARERLFGLIALTPNLDWLLLTKRPDRMAEYVKPARSIAVRAAASEIAYAAMTSDDAFEAVEQLNRESGNPCWPLPNLWLGTSVEDQAAADERIPHLLRCPAAVRFLSMEPLLGPVDLVNIVSKWRHWNVVPMPKRDSLRGIAWVIVGGESGPHARPMHPAWARSIRDQCQTAGVPFFFKQWGEWAMSTEPTDVFNRKTGDFETIAAGACANRVGKKAAGRLLDGREWNEMPSLVVA